MLTPDYLDTFTDPLLKLYEEFQQSIINDIARRIAKTGGVTASAAWQLQRITESGLVYENAIKEIARLTGKSQTELKKLFTQAGVNAIKFDDSIYKAAGLDPLPLNLSPAMAEVLAAGLRKTQGVMNNLTLTTAIAAQQQYIHAADLAYMQVSSGAMSYDQAIRAAVKGLADKGLSVVDYASGRVDQLDVSVRRAVLTGVQQTAGNLQIKRADEMGSDLVQTSAHFGSRPTHVEWQGRIFSRSGTHSKYPDFIISTGYGTVAGLLGANCRHSFYPFFEGISENVYNEHMRDALANKEVTYQGQRMSQYDASQIQRKYERRIRYFKRQKIALEAAGLDATGETSKVREYQALLRSFVRETGLPRQNVREQVTGQ